MAEDKRETSIRQTCRACWPWIFEVSPQEHWKDLRVRGTVLDFYLMIIVVIILIITITGILAGRL